jgi:hypothetical protein
MLSQDYTFLPLAEFIRCKDKVFDKYALDDIIFIKPDTNNKIFNGELVHRYEFHHWQNYLSFDRPEDELLCLISKPCELLSEYRLVLADNKVIAASAYRINHIIEHVEGCPQGVVELAEYAAAHWSPHRMFIMDIGRTTDGYVIIECGSINIAGFYQCKLLPIVDSWIKIASEEIGDES